VDEQRLPENLLRFDCRNNRLAELAVQQDQFLEAVQHAGYIIVNKDGEKLYCRTDTITGSRVQTHTSCLTEREMMAQNEATRRSMEGISSRSPAPPGK